MTEFTNQQHIDYARYGTVGDDNEDVSSRHSAESFLLLGLDGNDHLVATDGNDFLYGGDGNDIIVGNGGNDTFFGGQGNDVISGGAEASDKQDDGQTDTADYSQVASPITINYDGTGTGTGTAAPRLTVNDGTGGTDTLHSIEVVKATTGADTFGFKGSIPGGYALTVDFNGGQPVGRASVVNARGSTDLAGMLVTVDGSGNSVLKSKAGTGGAIALRNFGHNVIASDFNDTVTLANAASGTSGAQTGATGTAVTTVFGGKGNDTITAADGDSNLYGGDGGDGGDTITGGSGNDIIAGGAGNNIIHAGAGDDLIATPSHPNGLIDAGDGNDLIRIYDPLESGQTQVNNITASGGKGNDIYEVGYKLNDLGYSYGSTLTLDMQIGYGHDLVKSSLFPYGIGTMRQMDISKKDVSIIFDAHVVNESHIFNGKDFISHYRLSGDLAIIDNKGDSIVFQASIADIDQEDSGSFSGFQANGTFGINMPTLLLADGQIGPVHNGWESNSDLLKSLSLGNVSQYENMILPFSGRGNEPDQAIVGTNGTDTLSGGGGNDSLSAGDGNDTIDSSGGTDRVDGGAGQDQFRLFESLADFNRSLAAGQLVLASHDGTEGTTTLANVETIVSIADNASYSVGDLILEFGTAGDDAIAGTPFDDTITGLGGNDTITPGLGNDTIDGGAGIDTVSYADASSGVTVGLAVAGAQATGGSGSDALTGVESLTGSGFADTLTGDAGANLLTGGYGADTLTGNAGDDILYGNQDNDILYGNMGSDTLYGGQGDDILYGGQDNDQLFGNKGNDVLQGGKGADTLTGNEDADIFRYVLAEDSTVSAPDTITDFQHGIDKVDLAGIRTGSADTFTIATNGGDTLLSVDLGGNGSADMSINLYGTGFTASDILWSGSATSGSGGAAVLEIGHAFDSTASTERDFGPSAYAARSSFLFAHANLV